MVIAAALLAAQPLAAQHYIGIKGGYGSMMGRFYPSFESHMIWNRYTAGVAWKYYSEQKIWGGVSAEFEYQQRGYRLFETETVVSDTTSYLSRTRTVNSLTVPLIWQPHLYLFNRNVRFFLNLGVTFTYNLGIGDKMTVFTHNVDPNDKTIVTTSTVTTPYTMITARDNRFNYGLCGGAGLGLLFGRWEGFFEARYYFGMSDILRKRTKYTFNEQGTIRSELDNLYFNIGVFYRLGKGGIKAPPLRLKRTGAQTDENDFRNIKLEF